MTPLIGYRYYDGAATATKTSDYTVDPLERPIPGSTTITDFTYVGVTSALSREVQTYGSWSTKTYAYDAFGTRATITDKQGAGPIRWGPTIAAVTCFVAGTITAATVWLVCGVVLTVSEVIVLSVLAARDGSSVRATQAGAGAVGYVCAMVGAVAKPGRRMAAQMCEAGTLLVGGSLNAQGDRPSNRRPGGGGGRTNLAQ